MALGYEWVNIAHREVSRGQATITFWIDVKLKSQNTTNNYSVVETRLTSTISNNLAGSGYGFALTGAEGISGSGVWYFANETILTGETTIYHEADGSKNATVSAWCANSYWGIDESFSGSFDLPTIPRASQPSINTWPNNSPNFNIGDVITIHMNRKSTTFTHKVYFVYGNTSYLVAQNVTDNCNFDTSLVANNLYALIPNSNVYSNVISVETYSGNTLVGTKTCSYNARVVNSNPTFLSFNFAEQKTVSLTGDSTKIIKGHNRIVATIPVANKAIAVNSATMKSYQLSIGTKTVTASYSSDSDVTMTLEDFNPSILKTSMKVYAIDSRGNSTIITKTENIDYSFIDYTPISQSTFTVERTDNISETTKLNFTGKVDLVNFGSITNSLQSAIYKYKKTGDSVYTTGTTTITPTVDANGNISITDLTIIGDIAGSGFNQNDTFDILLELKDNLLNTISSSFTTTVTLNSGSPAIDIYGNKLGLGMPYDESGYGRIQLNKDVYVYDGTNYIPLFSENKINPELTNGIFATSEIKTNMKWIDNRTIYRKVMYISSLPNATLTQYPHGISNVEHFTNVYGMAYRDSDGYEQPINATRGSFNPMISARISQGKTYLELETGMDRSGMYAYVVLEYIKTPTDDDDLEPIILNPII